MDQNKIIINITIDNHNITICKECSVNTITIDIANLNWRAQLIFIFIKEENKYMSCSSYANQSIIDFLKNEHIIKLEQLDKKNMKLYFTEEFLLKLI
jgi:hypothetical protein